MNKKSGFTTASFTIVIILIIAMIFGAWKIKRWSHWKFNYGSRVERMIEKRVAPLEARIEFLENKSF